MAFSLFRRAPADHACSFCGAPRQAVDILVAGENVTICERCLVMATTVGNRGREGFHRFELLLRAIVDELAQLPKAAPAEEVDALTAAAVALAMGDAGRLGVMAGEALAVGRFRAALHLLEAVPPAERDAVWTVNCAQARHAIGDSRGAFELVDATPDPGFLVGGLLRLRRATARLGAEPAPGEAELRALLADLDRVDRELDLHPAETAEAHRRSVVAARARCRFALGEVGPAAELLRVEERTGTMIPEARLLLGDALAAAGDLAAAREAWQRAETDAWPESVVARDARERLGRPESPYR